MFKKPKKKTGEAINLKIYLLACGQKLIFNLGIPLSTLIHGHTVHKYSKVMYTSTVASQSLEMMNCFR